MATETGIEQVTGKVIGDKVRESWVPDYTDLYMQFKGIYFLLLVSQDWAEEWNGVIYILF